MTRVLLLVGLAVLCSGHPVDAADPGWLADGGAGGGYAGRDAPGDVSAGPRSSVARTRRPPRRVEGGPDYVGSNYGLGKPAVSGIGPRPDWGRSTAD